MRTCLELTGREWPLSGEVLWGVVTANTGEDAKQEGTRLRQRAVEAHVRQGVWAEAACAQQRRQTFSLSTRNGGAGGPGPLRGGPGGTLFMARQRSTGKCSWRWAAQC